MNTVYGQKALVIGGTGTLGYALLPLLLDTEMPYSRIRIMARDEHKLQDMERWVQNKYVSHRVDFIVGDVRDYDRLKSAMKDIDIVLHLAAMKTVDGSEYNPIEAKKTNIDGTQNTIRACHETGVQKAVFTSTDKAVAPINMYGASKLCAEKMWVLGNIGKKDARCKFSAVRYGNVLGSRGSVIEKWAKQGVVEITHPDMTRFWWLPEDAARFVLFALNNMDGGEVFIPHLKSCTMYQLAQAYGKPYKITGIRPGEKFHETLVGNDEIHTVKAWKERDCFVKYPSHKLFELSEIGTELPQDYHFTSYTAKRYTENELKQILIKTGKCQELEAVQWVKSMSS